MRKKALLLQKYLPSVACDFAATVNCLSRALGREKKGEIGWCDVDPIVVPAAQNYDFRAKSRAWQAATLANRVSSPSPCYLPPSLPISLPPSQPSFDLCGNCDTATAASSVLYNYSSHIRSRSYKDRYIHTHTYTSTHTYINSIYTACMGDLCRSEADLLATGARTDRCMPCPIDAIEVDGGSCSISSIIVESCLSNSCECE